MSSKTNERSQAAYRVRVPKGYPFEMIDRISRDMRENLSLPQETTVSTPQTWEEQDALELQTEPSQLVRALGNTQNSDNIAVLYFLGSFLKKYSDSSHDKACTDSAMEKFHLAEQRCKLYNDNGFPSATISSSPSDYHLQTDFNLARRRIRELIGDMPPINEIFKYSRHGPGSCSQCGASESSQYFKYRRWPYDVPPSAVDLAYDYIRGDDRWFGALDQEMRQESGLAPWAPYPDSLRQEQLLTPHPSNRICCVPKTRKTHRTIAIETALGVSLQLGVDGVVRRALKTAGINLNSQMRNQILARQGSLDGRLATLDLSMASDAVSLRLCEELLPPCWYELLLKLRSDSGILPDGTTIIYNKISSMGNGYTFALESLIFYALCWAVEYRYTCSRGPSTIGVYGDDLIVRSEIVPELTAMLTLCGFTLNEKKTFWQGPFRESCGTDWWVGRNIRPVFLRSAPKNAIHLVTQHNLLFRWWENVLGLPAECSSTLRDMRSWLPVQCQDLCGPINESVDSWLFSHEYDQYVGRCISVDALTRSYQKGKPTSIWFGKLMHQLRPMDYVNDPWVTDDDASGTRFVWNKKNSNIRIKRKSVFVTG